MPSGFGGNGSPARSQCSKRSKTFPCARSHPFKVYCPDERRYVCTHGFGNVARERRKKFRAGAAPLPRVEIGPAMARPRRGSVRWAGLIFGEQTASRGPRTGRQRKAPFRCARMAFKDPSTHLKNGRLRTWPDRENDGALWRDGERIARVYRHHDGRWQWFMQIGDCKTGIRGSKGRSRATRRPFPRK